MIDGIWAFWTGILVSAVVGLICAAISNAHKSEEFRLACISQRGQVVAGVCINDGVIITLTSTKVIEP